MFDFNQNMMRLIAEIVRTLPEFSFIRTNQIRISASYNRSPKRTGLLAYVLPMRYKDGSPYQRRVRGRHLYHYGITPTIIDGDEILYILYFLLPRFLNLALRDKLETVIHELYHISPLFNGDLRRLKGRSYIHGSSLKDYEENIRVLVDTFLKLPHDPSSYAFLELNATQLEKQYGTLVTQHIREPRPKLIHVESHSGQ